MRKITEVKKIIKKILLPITMTIISITLLSITLKLEPNFSTNVENFSESTQTKLSGNIDNSNITINNNINSKNII